MSHTSRARRAALAVSVVALAACFAATPANAAQLTQTYTCTYPLIGERALTVNIDADLPDWWDRLTPTPPFDVVVDAEADLGTYQGLDLIGANEISGVATATSTIFAPEFTKSVKVPVAIPGTTKPAAPPLRFEGLRGQTPSVKFNRDGVADITVDRIDLNLTAKRADGSAIVLPPVVPVDSDGDSSTFDVPCVLNPADQSRTLHTLDIMHGDIWPLEPPGAPFIASVDDVTPTSIRFGWQPSSTPFVTGYEVRAEGKVIDVGNVTAFTLEVPCGWTGEIAVRAYDGMGNRSEYGPSVFLEVPQVVDGPPSRVEGLTGTAAGQTSVDLSWAAATPDGPCGEISGYEVFQDGVKVDETTATATTITGLTADTAYRFKVRAIDGQSATGPFSDEVTVTTEADDATVRYGFDIAGVSVLKTLTRGTVPLSGRIDPELVLSTGAFSGDLQLNRTRARLQVLGLIPVTADIAFAPSDQVRGTLTGGQLTAQARFKIRLPQLYLFGVLPLTPQDTCQTKSATVAQLSSPDGFDALRGGRLTGRYAISDLTGCGLLEPFLNPLTKGGGNTLDLAITPRGGAV